MGSGVKVIPLFEAGPETTTLNTFETYIDPHIPRIANFALCNKTDRISHELNFYSTFLN